MTKPKATEVHESRAGSRTSTSRGSAARALQPPAYGISMVDRRLWATRDPLADAEARVQAAARSGDVAALDAALDAKLRLQQSMQRVEAGIARDEAKQARQKAAWLAEHPDLSVPAYARKVMGSLSSEDLEKMTSADYAWAVGEYEVTKQVRATLGPMASLPPLTLTPPKLDVNTPEIREQRASARAQSYADRRFLRGMHAARGFEASEIDALDDNEVAAGMWQFAEAERLAASPLANDALGDSKGPINHFLDGCEHGLFKVAHDVGNIGLAAGFTYDAITSDTLPEEPQWFGAAGRNRGHAPSGGELAWELAGNIPIIGQAQVLYGATEIARGAWRGDWNNVAYGVGNIAGSLMFGHALGKAPLERGSFGQTRIGKAYESARSYVVDEPPPYVFRSRVPAGQQLPTGEIATHIDVPSHAPGAPYSSRLPSGVDVEVAPHVAGTTEPVLPDLANRMHAAARSVHDVLPQGRTIATPDGQPLKIVFDPQQHVPYIDRSTGTVYMHPDVDRPVGFPSSGPGSELARWAPDPGSKPSEVIMQHELGHAAMPEIGAKIAAISTRKLARAFMQKIGLSPASEQTRLADARLAREEMLVHGLDELGADTVAVAAAKDLSAMPKSVAQGLAQAVAAHAKDPSTPLPAEFPTDPVSWMRRRDFADGGTIPTVGEAITPYDVFSGVRRHLGERYGNALTGPDAPKVIEALMASNRQFLELIGSPESKLLDADYVAANQSFNRLFDQNAAKLGLLPTPR
jgi:hypothetical protein